MKTWSKQVIINFIKIIDMKNIKTIIFNALVISVFSIILQSCDLMGLEFQTNYKHTPAPAITELNMTAYEFIKSRKDIDMALTFEAIEKAELRSLYETDSLTYFLIDDIQFSSLLTAKKVSSVAAVQKNELITILKGYVIKGLYVSSNMTTTPFQVTTENGVNVIQMRLFPRERSQQDLHQIQAGYIFSTGVSYKIVFSSNLKPTNGVIHILGARF